MKELFLLQLVVGHFIVLLDYKESYCHSAVVERITMYGERVRYFIETEQIFKCIETVRNVIATALW